ncbi:Leishmanolysin-like peptidase [Durusdinium trenchii]|uniref:Leishmanolysin-like peptidase n=2 Tax=Durusdinium trenchii TaxID=1381693 RepID=A0ABP0SCD3_9DINO
MDLQAAALREAITHFEDHKATYAIDHADTKRVIDEMREDFSIETKGCIEVRNRPVQECRSSLTEELARIRKEMASLGDELKQKMEEDRSAQDGKVKKMEELHEVVGKKLDDLELRFQQQPDPSTTVNAINAAMVANEKEAAKIQNALEEVSSSAAKMDQQRALFESRVSEAVKSCQDANAGAAKAVEMAQSHSEEAQRATTAVVTAATSAESQAQEAREAVQVLHNVAATAENHAQKAFEAKAAAEQAVETTAGHMLATTNALASVQSNVSSAENYAQAAAEAKAASQVAAESAESCKAAAADALSALQAKVASAESHAQTAFESKSAAERSAEASENHMVAATNALTAVQSNAESVREKTTEVEQHAASVKEIVLQMTEQASALQETTSAVAAASDRAILAVASEVGENDERAANGEAASEDYGQGDGQPGQTEGEIRKTPVDEEARLVRELSKEILQKLGEEARLSLDPIVPPAHLGRLANQYLLRHQEGDL